MYSHEPRVNHIAAAREHVLALHQSMNQPHLAVPGKQPQACQAYVVGTRNADGSRTVWVFLHLIETEEGVIFLSDNRALSDAEYPAEEGEALAFLESMGFMADDLHFLERPLPEQTELVATLPCFHAHTGKKAKATELTRAEKVARLLAAF